MPGWYIGDRSGTVCLFTVSRRQVISAVLRVVDMVADLLRASSAADECI